LIAAQAFPKPGKELRLRANRSHSPHRYVHNIHDMGRNPVASVLTFRHLYPLGRTGTPEGCPLRSSDVLKAAIKSPHWRIPRSTWTSVRRIRETVPAREWVVCEMVEEARQAIPYLESMNGTPTGPFIGQCVPTRSEECLPGDSRGDSDGDRRQLRVHNFTDDARQRHLRTASWPLYRNNSEMPTTRTALRPTATRSAMHRAQGVPQA
jgi:hypothetical protein